jgi:hypothetical protein
MRDLTLVYNKARQESITSELLDITGGWRRSGGCELEQPKWTRIRRLESEIVWFRRSGFRR